MKTIEEIESEQKRLQDKIQSVAENTGLATEKVWPIYDGVADVSAYVSSKPKIMWLLKEPWDDFDEEGNPCGGGWTIMEDLDGDEKRKLPLGINLTKSQQRIIYATRGIDKGEEYIDMWDYHHPEMYNYLFQIAYINLSKMPAGKKSGDMTAKYQIWKDIVLEQIKLYNPDVIVLGSTFRVIKEDLGIKNSDLVLTGNGWVDIYRKAGRIFADAYHPGIPGNDEMYVNTIAKYVRQTLNL